MPEEQELAIFWISEKSKAIPNATLENLTCLKVQRSISDIPEFISFLSKLPELTTVHCWTPVNIEDLKSRNISIPRDVVPLLQRYSGCLTLARLLVHGRPVEEVPPFEASGAYRGSAPNLPVELMVEIILVLSE